MSLTTEWIHYGAGPLTGYLCYPVRAPRPLPAVLVLQEAWGVDAHIEDVTRRFAAAGYAALAPDFMSVRGERPPALTRDRVAELQAFVNGMPPGAWTDPAARDAALAQRPEAERARIGESLDAMMAAVTNLPALVPAAVASARWLRTECAVTRGQKVASVGFCMGGGLSALLAAHDPELAAAVVFYGRPPPADLVPAIQCPVLGLYGGLDARINGMIPAFAEAMKQNGKRFEAVTYEGAEHAFFNDNRPSYHVGAARDAFVRTLAAFRGALGT
jgi:carboxymethylenebutenolidase